MSRWVLSFIWQTYIIKIVKNMFPLHICRPNDYKKRFNVLLQLHFVNIFTNVLSKIFTDILKIYELPKIYNKSPKYCQTFALAIIIYQAYVATSSSFWTIPLLTSLKMCPREESTPLALNFKKIPGRIFYKM